MLSKSVHQLVAILVVGAISAISAVNTTAQRVLAVDRSPSSPGPAVDGGTPSTIKSTVSTGFGLYTPYATPAFQASVGTREPSPKSDFSNVVVMGGSFPWMNYFSTSERDLLASNGFVARSEGVANFASAYSVELAPRPMGSFVTVDAVLHGLRLTLSESVRDMERNFAPTTLGHQLAALSESVADQAKRESNPSLSGSLLHLLAYIETGRLLLDGSADIDSRVEDGVRQEVAKIESRSQESPYYRARRWVSMVPFAIRSSSGSVDIESARQAILLSRTLEGLSSSGNFANDYRQLDEPVKFLQGGASDGLEWRIVATSVHQYYGRFASFGTGWINDDRALRGFVDYLAQQGGRSSGEPLLFRLYNWRDNASGSIDDEMSRVTQGPSRSFFNIYTGSPSEVWVQSLDRMLLYTMQPLAFGTTVTEGYPHFAQGSAWRDRQLASALGGWTSFRHAVVQSPMRSVAKASSYGRRAGDLETDGYVEPNPDAWGRLASLAGYLRSGFGDNIIDPKLTRKFQDIENASAGLMHVAARELEGKDLAAEQIALIASMRDRIIAYESFVDTKLAGAGFATTVGSAQLGNRAVENNYPLVIYVVVPRNDGIEGLMLTRGAIYSFQDAQPASRSVDASGERLLTASYMSLDRSREVDPKKFQGIRSELPASLAGVYIPPKKGKKNAVTFAPVVVDLESQLVSRTSGEVWFTIHAPGRTTGLVVTVVNSAGQSVKRTELGRLTNGERLDLVRINDLKSGQYYLRVEDLIGSQLAAGRFTIIE
jgi:hypothetical protein